MYKRQIMVRALGIPTVMGADIQPSVLHRRTLIVDGYRGELLVDPEPVLLQEYQRLISEEIELSRLAEDDVNLPAQLKSGERIKVMLNAGLSPEHEEKLGSRIDGIGLYRTEIPFMLQSGFPSEEEQVAQYQGMLQMFNDKPVTLRTLDVGADKQLPYMPVSYTHLDVYKRQGSDWYRGWCRCGSEVSYAGNRVTLYASRDFDWRRCV